MKKGSARFLGWMLFAASVAGSVLALSLAEPSPSVFSSPQAKFIVRVEPGISNKSGERLRNATATRFAYNEKIRSYVRENSFALENRILPGKMLITEDGSRIVGVDDWFDSKLENPVLIVYDEKGSVLKRFFVSHFLSRKEIEEIMPRNGMPFGEPWAMSVGLVGGTNEVRIIRDEVISGPGKKRDNFMVNLESFKIRRGEF